MAFQDIAAIQDQELAAGLVKADSQVSQVCQGFLANPVLAEFPDLVESQGLAVIQESQDLAVNRDYQESRVLVAILD